MWVYTTKGKIMLVLSTFLLIMTNVSMGWYLYSNDDFSWFIAFNIMLLFCGSILYSAVADTIEWKDKKGD
jgi:hypothetical protein